MRSLFEERSPTEESCFTLAAGDSEINTYSFQSIVEPVKCLLGEVRGAEMAFGIGGRRKRKQSTTMMQSFEHGKFDGLSQRPSGIMEVSTIVDHMFLLVGSNFHNIQSSA